MEEEEALLVYDIDLDSAQGEIVLLLPMCGIVLLASTHTTGRIYPLGG